MKATEIKDGLMLEVTVKPKSRQFKIAIEADEIVAYCTEEPTKGRVNKELLKGFTKLFHKEVTLVSGFTSRQKRLLIGNASKEEAEKILTNNRQ